MTRWIGIMLALLSVSVVFAQPRKADQDDPEPFDRSLLALRGTLESASLVALITIETFLLALCASAVGVAVGVGLDLYLLRVGIPLTRLSDFSLAGASIPPVIHATLTPEGVVLPFAMMLVAALLAAVWPALAAARVEPVIAMQDR